MARMRTCFFKISGVSSWDVGCAVPYYLFSRQSALVALQVSQDRSGMAFGTTALNYGAHGPFRVHLPELHRSCWQVLHLKVMGCILVIAPLGFGGPKAMVCYDIGALTHDLGALTQHHGKWGDSDLCLL